MFKSDSALNETFYSTAFYFNCCIKTVRVGLNPKTSKVWGSHCDAKTWATT